MYSINCIFIVNFSQILLYGILYYFSFVLFLDAFIINSSIYIHEEILRETIFYSL